MDIEKLTKSQIVLLTLLVSFVTSIATGIVTVALMQQAPVSVAASVNRIIERTVEKVVPTNQAAGVASATKTIIVHESDTIEQAVGKSEGGLVRLYSSDGSSLLGLGADVSSSGVVVSDASVIGQSGDASVVLPSGSTVKLSVVKRDSVDGLDYLTAASSSSIINTWSPLPLPAGEAILGESVILLSGEKHTVIGSGLVTSIVAGAASSPDVIETNIPESAILQGSLIIDGNGNLVGISTAVSRSVSPSGFISSTRIDATMK